MSGAGAPADRPDGAGLRIAIVAGRWHADVVEALLAGAVAEAAACGADCEAVRVPGAVELPYVAGAAARSGRFDAVVCLGVVIRGGTPHFDYVCRVAADGCLRVSLDHHLPVGFGVLTVDTVEQARERLDKGAEAVRAVIEARRAADEVWRR